MAKKGQTYIKVKPNVEDYTDEELIELGKRMLSRRLCQKRYLKEHPKEALEATKKYQEKVKNNK